MAGVRLAWRAMEPPAVKEIAEARGCLGCGAPTWSGSGYCVRCRRGGPNEARLDGGRDQPRARQVVLDAEGRLAEDVGCRGCGYNLRGLDSGAVCPECSTPVGHSIAGDLLAFANPEWIQRLATGTRLVALGQIASIVVGILTFLVVMSLAFRATNPQGIMTGKGIMVGMGLLATGLAMVIVWGTWMLTAPDPADGDRVPRWSSQNFARWGILSLVVQTALTWMSRQGLAMASPSFTMGLVLDMIATFGLTVISTLAMAAVLSYLRTLAVRMNHLQLAKQTRLVMWGYLVSNGLLMVQSIAFVSSMAPQNFSLGSGVMLGSCVTVVATVAFTIWMIVLLVLYSKRLKASAAAARALECRAEWREGETISV